MASRSKQKTTMAKLQRERRVLERRQEKQARKDSREAARRLGPQPEEPAGPADLEQDAEPLTD